MRFFHRHDYHLIPAVKFALQANELNFWPLLMSWIEAMTNLTTRKRIRWGVVAWKLPLVMLPLLPVALLLEMATAVTWFAYCVADKSRDQFNELWRAIDAQLPSSWRRP
jgi:hypothetical protein